MAWMYLKEGASGAKPVGPFSDSQCMELLKLGVIKPGTAILHPERTNGEWVDASTAAMAGEYFQEIERIKALAKSERQKAIREQRSQLTGTAISLAFKLRYALAGLLAMAIFAIAGYSIYAAIESRSRQIDITKKEEARKAREEEEKARLAEEAKVPTVNMKSLDEFDFSLAKVLSKLSKTTSARLAWLAKRERKFIISNIAATRAAGGSGEYHDMTGEQVLEQLEKRWDDDRIRVVNNYKASQLDKIDAQRLREIDFEIAKYDDEVSKLNLPIGSLIWKRRIEEMKEAVKQKCAVINRLAVEEAGEVSAIHSAPDFDMGPPRLEK